MNTYFSDIVGSLNIPEYVTRSYFCIDSKIQKISECTHYRRSIQRKKKHAAFSFSEVAKEKIFRDILNLDIFKACQDTDIPCKLIKESADIFVSFLHSSFNMSVTNSEFPSVLKQANITLVF